MIEEECVIEAVARNIEALEFSIERFRFGQLTGDRLIALTRFNVWAILETTEETFDLKQAGNELIAAVDVMVDIMRPAFPAATQDVRIATATDALATFLRFARNAKVRPGLGL